MSWIWLLCLYWIVLFVCSVICFICVWGYYVWLSVCLYITFVNMTVHCYTVYLLLFLHIIQSIYLFFLFFFSKSTLIITGMIFFSYLTWFQLFSSENCFPKVAGHGQNRSKRTILKGGVDGCSYFSLMSVIYFLSRIIPVIINNIRIRQVFL